MISFDAGSHRFNLRAAAVIRHDGYLLLHRAEGDGFWSFPGGRVEPGEAGAQTVAREMAEEIDATVEVGPMLCLVENFYTYRGQPYHELGLYFSATLAPDSPLLDRSRAHHGEETGHGLTFRWFALDALAALDIRPGCLREQILSGDTTFTHVVHDDPDPA
ncbi:MAG: CTP pyrophosphohydrolase [Burkholderia plantarii]|nr:MAG: CTP pyrophosphohydrolase [Burkholderia plantarii]